MLGSLNKDQIVTVLKQNSTGRIGCTDGTKVYVVPVTYAFDGENIIGHTQPGLKVEMMRSNPHICFEVDEMQSLKEWKSVIAWGNYSEVTDDQEKRSAMRYFIQSILHLEVGETGKFKELPSKSAHPHEAGTHTTIVFKIHLNEMTGRFESK